MSINKGKHNIIEIGGTRCTVVEAKTTKDRVEFLKNLLEFNGFSVLVLEEAPAAENESITYTVGVTDIVFNPVIAVYSKRLKTPEGKRVSPAYWNQWKEPANMPYWMIGRI